jgi:hypothetical protein
LKEGYNVGRNVTTRGQDYIIPASNNSNLKSPVDGRVIRFKPMFGCSNQFAIDHLINKQKYVLVYCNVGRQQKNVGDYVRNGDSIASLEKDKNVIARLYDKNWKQISFDNVSTPTSEPETKKGREKDVKLLPSYKKPSDVNFLPTYKKPGNVNFLANYKKPGDVNFLKNYEKPGDVNFLPKYK